jgi:integrase
VAHLTRVHRTRYLLDGRRVPKGTKGAKTLTEKSDLWYGCKIPGQPPKKRIPLARDREAAERMLAKMVRDAEHGIANVPNRKAANTTLADFLKDFKSSVTLGLASRAGRLRRLPDEKQVGLVVQRVRDLLDGCAFEYPADLNADAPQRLAEHMHARMGKTRNKSEKGISAQSANFYVAAARRFARWLHDKVSTVRPDLFDRLPAFDAANARTHARREITPDELNRVFEAARASKRVVRRLTGEDRYHLYMVAFSTGFRATELSVLTPDHFSLDADPPAVSLPGKATKNKKSARPPLVPGVAVALRGYLKGKERNKPIWPGKWALHAAKMLRIDLAAANVPYCVDGPDGKAFADFHALRHTFCSALAASGAGVKELQTLARHGDSRTTLNLYTHARSAELVRTINRLQVPGATAANPLAHVERDQLEGIVLGLVVLLGSILSPTGHSAPPSSGAPRGAPEMGISGDSGEPVGTRKRAKRAGG